MNPFDEMKREQKRLLYNPNNYEVAQSSPGHWRAEHLQTGVWFIVEHVGFQEVEVYSESGNSYHVNAGVCDCPDAANRAIAENRLCKHAAVALAIASFQRKKREKENQLDGAKFRKVMK